MCSSFLSPDDCNVSNLILRCDAHSLGDTHVHIRRICGDAVAHKCKPIWGLDTDGEIYGAWRDMGVKGLWYLTGTCKLCSNVGVDVDVVYWYRQYWAREVLFEAFCVAYVVSHILAVVAAN